MRRYLRRPLLVGGSVLGLFALAASWLLPRGDWAKAPETQATNSPIKHVIVIMMENHSFDNLFGRFPGVNGAMEPHASNPLEGDNDHTSPAALAAIDGGRMDEFLPNQLPYSTVLKIATVHISSVDGQALIGTIISPDDSADPGD